MIDISIMERADNLRIRLLYFYLLLCPVLAFRLSDGVSIGLQDAMLILIGGSILFIKGRNLESIVYIYTAFVAFAVVSYLINSMLSASFSFGSITILRLLTVIVPFVLVYQIFRIDYNNVRTLFWALFWGGAIIACVGILLYELGIEFRSNQQRIWVEGFGYYAKPRAGGFLGNSGDYGHIISIWAVSVTGLSVMLKINRPIMIILVLSVALYGSFIASSRAALIHILIASAIILTNFGILRFILLSLSALIAYFIFMLNVDSLNLSPHLMKTIYRFDFFDITGYSIVAESQRFGYWSQLAEVWTNNPFLGLGYQSAQSTYGIYADNAFVGSFVEFGIFAGFFYCLFWVVLIFRGVQLISVNRTQCIVALAMILSELFHALTVTSYTLWYSMPISFIIIAITLRARA